VSFLDDAGDRADQALDLQAVRRRNHVLRVGLPAEKNRIVDAHEGKLAEDGKLTGSLSLEASGDWGWLLRTSLQSVPEATRDQALRGVIARIVENARYQSGTMAHLTDPERPMLLSFKYEADRFSTTAGNFLLVRLPWGQTSSGGIDSLGPSGERTQDVEVSVLRGHYFSSVKLELPQGYTVQDLQPVTRRESRWGWYQTTYRMEGNTLHAERELKMTAFRVPSAEFAEFAEFLRALEQETSKQLVLKKG
jgi:hypothetical protein